jgi:hypothetical protein
MRRDIDDGHGKAIAALRYCVGHDVVKHGPDAWPVWRMPAADVEAAVVGNGPVVAAFST